MSGCFGSNFEDRQREIQLDKYLQENCFDGKCEVCGDYANEIVDSKGVGHIICEECYEKNINGEEDESKNNSIIQP